MQNISFEEFHARQVVAEIKFKFGRKYKSLIRHCWESGCYEYNGVGEYSQQLQFIRNKFGPTWLDKLKIKSN